MRRFIAIGIFLLAFTGGLSPLRAQEITEPNQIEGWFELNSFHPTATP